MQDSVYVFLTIMTETSEDLSLSGQVDTQQDYKVELEETVPLLFACSCVKKCGMYYIILAKI